MKLILKTTNMKHFLLLILILCFSCAKSQTLQHGNNVLNKQKADGTNFFFMPDYMEVQTGASVVYYEYADNSTGIIEGVVNDTDAASNTVKIEQFFANGKAAGYNYFRIDNLDAFFKTDNEPELPWTASINIPSDVHLTMTNNTHLRQQPNAYRSTTLLAIAEVNNVTIDGGNLHGDRDTHDYDTAPNSSHEWGHCLRIASSKYVTIKNMTIADAGGDAIDVQGTTHVTDPNHISAQYVNILNNTLLRSRRNGISVTGGEDILIDGNTLHESGVWTDGSNGVYPGWAIDVEAVVGTEIAERIVISNNIETASQVGSFICFIGDYITIENNQCETGISLLHTDYTICRNNTLIADSVEADGNVIGITTSEKAVNQNTNNEIYGNTIDGFRTGMSMGANNNVMYNNIITNFSTGILLDNSTNCKIYGNTATSTKAGSIGMSMASLTTGIDGLVVGAELNEANTLANKNTFNVVAVPFRIEQFNTDVGQEAYEITVKNNEFISSSNSNGNLFFVNGVTFKDNIVSDQMFVYSINDCVIDSNSVGSFRMGISDTNAALTNSSFTNNIIASGCVSAPTDSSNLTITGNTCN